jgi:phosphoribosylanthranilate isomerase
MTWVKICGTTNLEDALVAVEAGADALGFIFYEKSPRKVDVQAAQAIVAKLPVKVEKVGVFVDQTGDRVREIVQYAGLTAAQLHGEAVIASVLGKSAGPEELSVAKKLIQVVPVDKLADGGVFLSDDAKKRIYAILLDSGSSAVPGGTGKPFDWEKTQGTAQTLSFTVPVIVAGGLTPSNVGEAMARLQPFGVDVASGVEARPGKKDPDKVRAFVRAVRQTDRKTS